MSESVQLGLKHQKVQRLRRLVGRRSAREAERSFVVEGAKVLGEALAAGVLVESVFIAPGTEDPVVDKAFAAGARVFELGPGTIEKVADTVTPQPIIAIVPAVDIPLDQLSSATFVVVMVDVRDPGNAGTIFRSAEAAGAAGVISCRGSVDVFNPKTVRASAGSVFHVPVVVGGDALQVLEQVGGWGLRRLGASARSGHDYAALDLRAPVAFVMGNEAGGLPDDLAAALDGFVSIPMEGRSESLNVGMATAVLCFETARQRRHGGHG